MNNLSKKIVNLLRRKNLKISFAESCTGGLLSSRITSVAGSSKVFNLGLITYSNNTKINTLKVPKKILNKHGAVSYETCLSMVKNLNKISKTNISLSITDIKTKNFAKNPPNGGIPANEKKRIKKEKANIGLSFESPERSSIFSVYLLSVFIE